MANKFKGSARDSVEIQKGVRPFVQGKRRLLTPPSLVRLGLLSLALITLGLVMGTFRVSEPAIIARMYRNYAEDFPDVEAITVTELQQWQQQKDIVLVDVRDPKERAVSILPGAISKAEFERDRDRYQNKTIVPYCTIGYRSGLYAQNLQTQGFRVFNLAGSILSWTHAGGSLINSDGSATHQVHVYGRQWNLTAEGYEAVW